MPSRSINLGSSGGRIVIETSEPRSSRRSRSSSHGMSRSRELSDWNLLQIASSGKGLRSSQLKSAYRNLNNLGGDRKFDCKPKFTRSGNLTVDCKPRGYGALETILGRGVEDEIFDDDADLAFAGIGRSKAARRALLGIDFDDEDDVDEKLEKSGTFNHSVFMPKPETKRPVYSKSKDFCSDNKDGKVFETKKGKCVKANYRLVFLALHAKNGWMKIPAIREGRYQVWKQRLYDYCDGDDERIAAKLADIIKRRHLNPSERTGESVGSSSKFKCEGDDCFFRVSPDGKDGECVKPTAEDYFNTKYTADKWSKMTPAAQAQEKYNMRQKFEKMDAKERCNQFDSKFKYDRSKDSLNEVDRLKAQLEEAERRAARA